MLSKDALARFEALSGIERGRFTPQLEFRRPTYNPTDQHFPLRRRHSSTHVQPPCSSPLSAIASTAMMDANQLASHLDALTRDFAQYRVEMALRVENLERRLAAAEGALTRLSNPEAAQAPHRSDLHLHLHLRVLRLPLLPHVLLVQVLLSIAEIPIRRHLSTLRQRPHLTTHHEATRLLHSGTPNNLLAVVCRQQRR